MILTERAEIGTALKLYGYLAGQALVAPETTAPDLEVYIAGAYSQMGEIDYLKLIDLDNRRFARAVFALQWNTLPPEEWEDLWRPLADTLPREEFRRRFMTEQLRDPNQGDLRERLCNFFLLEEQPCPPPAPPSLKRRVLDRLWPLYMKLPVPVRKVLKKTLRGVVLGNET